MASSVNTNWMTLGYGGVANPGAASEKIPVLVDSTTTYSAVITTAIQSTGWAAGFTLSLTFYSNTDTSLLVQSQTINNLVVSNQMTAATTPTVAPSGCANGGYCVITVQLNGSPASTNPLDIFSLKCVTGSNTNIPDIVNYNYSFVSGTWPWAGSNNAVLNAVATAPSSSSAGAYDSLVIAGSIELMGGPGVQTVLPFLTDPSTGNSVMYRISTPGGQLQALSQSGSGPYDLGAPQPTQDLVESQLLDGERPFGSRTSNREMVIPVAIYAPTQATLDAARDYLLSVIDQQDFEITWTPKSTGLTTIYDCFRALPSTIMYGFNNLREGAAGAPAIGMVTITIQASPFGRSGIDGLVEVDFASGLAAGNTAASTVVLDDFTGVIDTADGWISNTQYPVVGSNCAFHRNPSPVRSPYPAVVYSKTFAAKNLANLPVLGVWLGQSYDTQWPADPKFKSNVTVVAVLTDTNGKTVSCKTTVNSVPWNSIHTKPAWKQISIYIPQKKAGFSYSAVTGIKLTITNWAGGGTTGYVRMNAWLGYVAASALSVTSAVAPRGILYNMWGPPGSARGPVNAQVQLPNADSVVQEFFQNGYYQVPPGTYSLQAECWGSGGAGSSVSSSVPGAGGGGGEYSIEPSLSVVPGTKIPMQIGQGGQPAQLTPTVVNYKTHGTGLTWTCPALVTSVQVEIWAGGAAGAPGGGGAGAGGYTNNTVTVVPGTTYSMYVGNGGRPNTGTSSQAQMSRNGQNSWFGPSGTKYISNAYCGAFGGTSPAAGSASGGTGGKGMPSAYLTRAYQGGAGGRSPGGAGGGGGASGASTGAGGNGQASPKLGVGGGGDYLTGGAGGTGPGGGGGAGASVPGAASPGVVPGGAGGGGYTKTVTGGSGAAAVNYQGAAGAPGMIRLTYTVNAGAPVNGTSTVFGSASTTSTTVTAHGGVSAAANTTAGGGGGSGSGNSAHFPGGTGGLCQRNGNMQTSAGTGLQTLAVSAPTAVTSAAITSGATITQATIETGVQLMVAIQSAAALANPYVSDNAGNIYYLASSTALTDSSCLQIFISPLKYQVSSGHVLTVAADSAFTAAVTWGAISNVRDLEDSSIASNTGSSSTGSVSRTYADASATYFEMFVIANNGTSVTQAGLNASPGGNGFTSSANGTLGVNFATRMANGSASSVTLSGSLGGSMPWALVSLPFILSNQNGVAVPTTAVENNLSGTSATLTPSSTGPMATNMDVSTGYHIVKVHAAGAATYTVSDNGSGGSNTYSQLGTVAAGTGQIYIFGAPITHSLSAGFTLTFTSTVNQQFTATGLFVPGAVSSDSSGVATNTGTGTAVSVTFPAGTTPGKYQLATLGYASSSITSGSPAWASNSGAQIGAGTSSAPASSDYFYALSQNALGTSAFTETLSSSTTWGIIVVSLVTPGYSGGGGASGGVAGAGMDATCGLSGGAPGYAFGGKGANGVLGNSSGATGAIPGGGGSGAARSSGSANWTGGPGANGLIRVTHQPPMIAFNDFILHRPGPNAPADLNPLVPIPVSDPPDNREYAVPQTVAGRNAVFKGTYTVWLCAASWDSPGTKRRISVTVNQYEYLGGPAVSVQATRTVTPATDVVNGYVSMGELTLPIKSVPRANTDAYYTVSVHDTDQSDSFQDLIFLDTMGQTVLVNIAPGTAGDSRYVNYYVDEPGLDSDLGNLLGSSHERDRATSVTDMAIMTGGPLYVAPGDNLLLVYSTKGAPNLQVTYAPRWYSDRVV